MFMRIKHKLMSVMPCVRCVSPAYILVSALLLAAALIVRVFSGSGCVMCKFSGGVGLFPGTFFYTLGYIVRLVLCGILLASALFSFRVEKRAAAVAFSAVACFMMLFEYKLIFVMYRFFAALLLCLACGAASFVSLMFQRGCERQISICALLYTVMQTVFFVQLLSLIFCI